MTTPEGTTIALAMLSTRWHHHWRLAPVGELDANWNLLKVLTRALKKNAQNSPEGSQVFASGPRQGDQELRGAGLGSESTQTAWRVL